MTLNEMMNLYNTLSAAHKYIFGFFYKHNLYYVTLTFAELAAMMQLDHASSSKGGKAKIRIRSHKEQREAFVLSGKAVLLGSETMINPHGAINRGWQFEKIMTELLTDEEWHQDKIPFFEAGDIEVNGEQIQVKFDDAELTNEQVLKNRVLALGW